MIRFDGLLFYGIGNASIISYTMRRKYDIMYAMATENSGSVHCGVLIGQTDFLQAEKEIKYVPDKK